MSNFEREKRAFLKNTVQRGILVSAMILALLYFYIIAFTFPTGYAVLFALLIAGEIFHVYQVGSFIATVWQTETDHRKDESYMPHVDIFITVAGEPEDIVETTVVAARAIDYSDHDVFLLNDGFVAKKENWQAIEALAQRLGVRCITRQIGGGAKAGNINNALKETAVVGKGGLVVILDADHVPHADFLKKTVPYFVDPKVAFVQSPQFYKNFAQNYVTRSAWEQQQLFFGAICKGKDAVNAATMCGTNMVIRRDMLLEVGGMAEQSIAEDFITGIMLHTKGYKSVYVPEVLAEGLAPEDFLSYFKQQFRWARGAFDVFSLGLFTRKGLTFAQRFQYFASVSFYFSGLVIVINAMIPLVYFYTGAVPFTVSTMLLAAAFLPYLFLTLYVIQQSSNFTFTFRALTFSMGSFTIHLRAMWAALTREKSAFHVTSKKEVAGNFVDLVIPHITYILMALVGMVIAFRREGFSASLIANSAWALLMIGIFVPFIYAALPASVKKKGVLIKQDLEKDVVAIETVFTKNQ